MRFILIILFCISQTGLFAQKKGQDLIDSILRDLPAMKEDTNKIKALNKIGEVYFQINPKIGIGYVDSALLIAEKLNWKRGTARLENLKGLLIGDTGNNTQARVHFLKSYALYKEMGNSFSMISNLNNIGRSYQFESNFTNALEYFFKALTLAEEIKDNGQIALVGTNLETSFHAQGNIKKSLEYAEMTYKYAVLSNTPNNIGKALSQLGLLKGELGDTVAARMNLEKALKVYQDIGDLSGIVQVLTLQGTMELPNYKKSIEIMLKAQKIWDEIGPNTANSAANQANLGSNYLDLARQSHDKMRKELLDKSGFYLKRAMAICKEIGDNEHLAVVYVSMANLEEEEGNFKEALTNFKKSYNLNDSLFSQEKKNELAGLENKHNLEIKNKEIAIGQLELISQRKTQLGLFIGLALLGVIGGMLFWQNRMRKKSNTTLMVLNNQLDEANKVKAKFFGILSHDLRSPISSLINFLYLLKNEPELISANERATYQQQIGQSTEELLQTMETMLVWSKEQMDHFKPDIKILPVNDLFDYLQKFFAQTSQVKISFNDPEGLEVSADENYLKVIMQNLTSNAIKALRNDPAGTITWKARKDGLKTILSITDNGPGINAEQIKALYHEESAVNAKTGFGFHLIRDLAKAIQYHITIESRPGMGTTFILSS
jgi:signal transduction histidine kinase